MAGTKSYQRLVWQNMGAKLGIVLATDAVYAAKFGRCETEQLINEEWLLIAELLKETYGDFLTTDQVLAEMKSCALPDQ
jgi:hypothetical protein